MKSIWICSLKLQPAGPLTFRRMPSGSLPIMTYPFVPPTTLNGYLVRLLKIAEGARGGGHDADWPGYGEDWFAKGKDGKTAPGQAYILTLSPEYRPLGAFPPPGGWSIHKTRRQGPKNFAHVEFSQIIRSKGKIRQDFQLHHWEYLLCDELTGWVAASEPAPLERLRSLVNYGGKVGKEGFLVVKAVDKPREAPRRSGTFEPVGLVPASVRPAGGTFFHLYGHRWNADYLWINGERGGVTGYVPIGVWWETGTLQGEHWSLGDGRGIPLEAPDLFLQGDREVFS